VTRSEVQTYTNLANQYGYVVVLVEPRTPWKFQAQKLAAKNTHNVSYTKICRKVEQFDEILPHYFGWFLSPAECVGIQTMAKDVLWKCLQVPEFQQCIKTFSGDFKYSARLS
jgi:2',3'-cyclic-nucleotide 3'-phosphodiesterase